MANKPDFKDRRRDLNPKNAPPKAQVKEQKVKGRAGKDIPARQPTRQPRKPAGKKQVPNRKAGGGKTEAKRGQLNPLLRVTDTQSGSIHDEAARLKLRATGQTSPREVVKVEGNPLEVVARPEVLHPVELLPHQRDTVIKDDLRDRGEAEATAKADGTYLVEPPDWRDETPGYEADSPDGRLLKAPPKVAKK